jgi:hypothetical protein
MTDYCFVWILYSCWFSVTATTGHGEGGAFAARCYHGREGRHHGFPPSVSPLREAICFVLGPAYQWEGVMARRRDLGKLCIFALELGRAPRRLFLRRAKKVANVECKQRDDVLDGPEAAAFTPG